MKRPTYHLSEDISIGEDNYSAGTMIHPVFNEGFLPEHLKDKLKEAKRLYSYPPTDYVMCLIGMNWFAIGKNKIKERT